MGMFSIAQWIFVNGTQFLIQPNLRQFLLVLRKKHVSIRLWIDAVSIDQSNNLERSHQVQLMGDIYSRASSVIAWLGLATAADKVVFNDLKDVHASFDLKPDSDLNQAYLSMGEKSYWYRAWIRQELILAKSVMICCGRRKSDLRCFLQRYVLVIRESHLMNDILRGLHVDVKTGSFGVTSRRRTLENLLQTYGNAQCTDVRDRVYALLSMAEDCRGEGSLVADYDIPTALLFFALMQPYHPTSSMGFAWHLRDILMLHSDHIAWTIRDGKAFHEFRQKPSLLSQRAFDYIDTLHQQLVCYREHEDLVRNEYWRNICWLCTPDLRGAELLPTDRFYKIGEFNIALVMRPSLSGVYLHGLAQHSRNDPRPSWYSFDPEKASRVLADIHPQRLKEYQHCVTSIIDQRKPPSAHIKARIRYFGLEIACLLLQYANNSRNGGPSGYRLNVEMCRLVLTHTFGYELRKEPSLLEILLNGDIKGTPWPPLR
ncbi:MAG: hypothetical protein Q9227_004486 [Pyrenula ochraceoflavens]